MKKICVLGLGYIGLPTAAMFATHGFAVAGVDINAEVVETLNNGDVHIQEPGLKTLVKAALKSGNLRVACRPEPADAFIIAVPTPLRAEEPMMGGPGESADHTTTAMTSPFKRADLSYVIAAAESIVPHLRPGNLVVLESTVPPRTTVDILLSILERSGLRASRGGAAHNGVEIGGVTQPSHANSAALYVAHCPERVLPGRILEELVGNDRVIGGVNTASAEMAQALYASFVEGKSFITDATTAEMVKLMENTYRDVNIALANEFSLVAEQLEINAWEAIELANRHPRVNILKPGPGVGGHCIAVDPWFIVQAAPGVTPLIQTARSVNDGMPTKVVALVKRAVAEIEEPTVACLGLAYKADVDDVRESPAIEVVHLLQAEGFKVRAFDPYVSRGKHLDGLLMSTLEAAVDDVDCIVILTDHREFRLLVPEQLNGMRHRIVVDARNALSDLVWQSSETSRVTLGVAP